MSPSVMPKLVERDWQEQVIELAHALGWKHMHARRSKGRHGWTTAVNVTGWPDLVLWSEKRKRLVFAELKSDTGKLTDEQRDVLDSLRRSGQEAFVWRPQDFESVRRVLGG